MRHVHPASRRDAPGKRDRAAPRRAGFALLEMLIAMLLTALMGTVIFSTYRNVAESGKSAEALVASQEHPRMFRSILDDDISSIFTEYDRRLPLLSRRRITTGEAYRKVVPEETAREEAREDDEILFSFATTAGLGSSGVPSGGGLYCVEYVLRNRPRSLAFIRRERPHCGVDGVFAWEEHVLLPSVYRVTGDVWPIGAEGYVAEWQGMLSSEDVPRALRFTVWHTAEDAYPEVLVVKIPERFMEKDRNAP